MAETNRYQRAATRLLARWSPPSKTCPPAVARRAVGDFEGLFGWYEEQEMCDIEGAPFYSGSLLDARTRRNDYAEILGLEPI